MNDWLGGSWLFLWGCLLGTFVCIPLFFVAVANGSSLQMFIFGTSYVYILCYSDIEDLIHVMLLIDLERVLRFFVRFMLIIPMTE